MLCTDRFEVCFISKELPINKNLSTSTFITCLLSIQAEFLPYLIGGGKVLTSPTSEPYYYPQLTFVANKYSELEVI
jgi:hypothetical protein